MKKLLMIFVLLISVVTVSAQQKRCFMVGISDYGNVNDDPEEWSNISGANDVRLLAPKFESKGFEVDTLVDQSATYQNIVDGFGKLIDKCNKGDLVYVHFSCHGQPFEDLDGDEEDGWDEALIPYDAKMHYKAGVYEGKSHLLDDELEKYLSSIRQKIGIDGMLYVVLDACHSGSASRGNDDHVRGVNEAFTSNPENYYRPDRTKETNDNFKIASKQGESHVVYVEACRSYQTNREVRDKVTNIWYGSLSYYINQVLMDGDITNDASWIESVRSGMANNNSLRRQNMVVESSLDK